MKLSQRDIRIIEDVFASIASGETITRTAEIFRLGKHGMQALSATLTTLERIGVTVPKRPSAGERRAKDWAEFLAWKASQNKPDQYAPIVSRNGAAPHYAD